MHKSEAKIREMLGRHCRDLFENEDLTLLKVQAGDLLDAVTDGANTEELKTSLTVIRVGLETVRSRLLLIQSIIEVLHDEHNPSNSGNAVSTASGQAPG